MKRILCTTILIFILSVQGFAQKELTYFTSTYDKDGNETTISLLLNKRHPTENKVRFFVFIYRNSDNNALVLFEADCDTFRYFAKRSIVEVEGETVRLGKQTFRTPKSDSIMVYALIEVCGGLPI